MVGFRMMSGAAGGPGGSPQVQDAPSAIDFTPSRPMNQVFGFSCTTTLRNGYVIPEMALTPVTELGKVQFTAIAPAAVLVPHPAAEVVAV
jgi:hypothetical protein